MNPYQRFEHFTEEDFVLDHQFKYWVLEEKEKSIPSEIQKLIHYFPDKERTILNAQSIILDLSSRVKTPSQRETLEVQRKIKKGIQIQKRRTRIHRRRFTVAAAATILLLISLVYMLDISNPTPTTTYQTYSTDYGEIKAFTLPDGSIVRLNANSNIRFQNDIAEDTLREVWLTGEAFFEVQKKINRSRFVVHSDEIDVEVLGTKFNVQQSNDKVQVFLSEGSIKINAAKEEQEGILVEPNELAEYQKDNQALSKALVQDSELHTAWQEHKLVCISTQLSEIAEFISKFYGKEVIFQATEIKEREINGSIPTQDLIVFLEILEESMKIQTTIEGNKIYFQ